MALTSTISNRLTDPDGNAIPFALVTISLVTWGITPFRLDDFSEISPIATVVSDNTGLWSLALERNSNVSIANSYYIAQELIPANNVTNQPISGIRTTIFQVGATNQTLQAAAVAQPLGGPVSYLTQAAGDARYVLAPGTFGAAPASVTPNATPSGGALTTYSRSDHQHNLTVPVRARAHKEANTVLGSSIVTTVTYKSPSDYDPSSNFNPLTGVFTCPVAGLYFACGCTNLGSFTAGGAAYTGVSKNGVAYGRGQQRPVLAADTIGLPFAVMVPCLAGDTLNVHAFQTTGANCNMTGAPANPDFTYVSFHMMNA